MTDKEIIIDGVDVSEGEFSCSTANFHKCDCQEYLDGDCSAHKCDLKIIRKLESKLEIAKQGLNLILTVQKECKKCPHQELDIDVLVCDLDCATAFKKIAKQTLKTIER